MYRIRISYEQESELQDIVRRLNPLPVKVKRAEQTGRYKRAYITPIREQTFDKTRQTRYNILDGIDAVPDIETQYPIG